MRRALGISVMMCAALYAWGISGVRVAGDVNLRKGERYVLRADSGTIGSVEIRTPVAKSWRHVRIGEPLYTVGLNDADGVTVAEVTVALGPVKSADDDCSRLFTLSGSAPDGFAAETAVAASANECTLQLMQADGNRWEAWFGDESYTVAGDFECVRPVASATVCARQAVGIASANLLGAAQAAPRSSRWSGEEEIAGYLAAAQYDMYEGIYEYLDCDLDTRRARRGGNYRIAVVKGSGGYDIIYLGGAEVNAPVWRVGMLKGHLAPTPFSDSFTLTWTDADGNSAFEGAWALLSGTVVELHFPAESATLRFTRTQR